MGCWALGSAAIGVMEGFLSAETSRACIPAVLQEPRAAMLSAQSCIECLQASKAARVTVRVLGVRRCAHRATHSKIIWRVGTEACPAGRYKHPGFKLRICHASRDPPVLRPAMPPT